MRMKLRGLLLLTIGAVAFGLAACGGSSTSGSGGTTGSGTAKHYDVAFVPNNIADPYFITMQCGIQDAAKGLNVSVATSGPTVGDVTKELAVLDAVIAKHPDAILLDAEDQKAFDAPIQQAVSEGIKVFFVNAAPADLSKGSGFVATDDKAGGVLAGKEMLRLVGAGGGSVMSLGYNRLASLRNRQDGFTEAIAGSQLNYVGNFFDPQDDAAKEAGMVSANLAKHADLVGVYGLFGSPGANAVTAIRTAGKAGKVKIITYDATPELVADLKAGSVQGLVVQQPAQIGAVALKQLVSVLNGGPKQGVTSIPPVLITPQNLAANQKYLYKSSC